MYNNTRKFTDEELRGGLPAFVQVAETVAQMHATGSGALPVGIAERLGWKASQVSSALCVCKRRGLLQRGPLGWEPVRDGKAAVK